jgi:hypothetical protein
MLQFLRRASGRKASVQVVFLITGADLATMLARLTPVSEVGEHYPRAAISTLARRYLLDHGYAGARLEDWQRHYTTQNLVERFQWAVGLVTERFPEAEDEQLRELRIKWFKA